MKEVTRIEYRCEVCNSLYTSSEQAIECENRPVTQDKGVKVGDVVRITSGQGVGDLARVKSIFVIDKNWGHYAWERYWHTVAITGDTLERAGQRLLVFDAYELVEA